MIIPIIQIVFCIKKIGFKQKITEKNYPIDKLDYKNIPRKKDFILKFEDDTKIS